MTGADNLLKLYAQADRLDRSDGMKAYLRYHDLMAQIAAKYGQANNIDGVVGAFCALSPNNDYVGNLRSLVSMLEAQRLYGDAAQGTVSTFKACRARAAEYLHQRAHFLDHAKGLKTRAFYQNITDPTNIEPVTIDGHMVLAFYDLDGTMKDAQKLLSIRIYREIADAVRMIARAEGIIPHQMQAILWMTRKRVKQVKFDPQLDVFSAFHGAQKTTFDLQDIQPFPTHYNNAGFREAVALEDLPEPMQALLL